MQPEPADASVRGFLEKAQHDLAAARLLLDQEELADIVCFHSQQTAEKALKAALLSAGCEVPRTHDLPRLLDELVESDGRWEAIRLPAEALSDFAVAPRYPEWELTYPTADPGKAVDDAATILAFVIATLR